jgi:type II secretory pathway component PulK
MWQATRSRGAALITALMVMAIVATLSTAMMMTQNLLIQESGLIKQNNQAYLDLQGVQGLVRLNLLTNWAKHKGHIYDGSLLFKTQAVGIDDTWQGRLYDANGLFNINWLEKSADIPYFAKLISLLDTNISSKMAMTLSKRVYEWMLANNNVGVYGTLNPPYQPAHQAFSSASELRLVSGFSAALLLKLTPYIVALPKASHWNINTAPSAVIASMMPKKEATLTNAAVIVHCRKKKLITSAKILQGCLTSLGAKNVSFPSGIVGFSSKYFILSGSLTMKDDHDIPIASLFKLNVAKATHVASVDSAGPAPASKVPPEITLLQQMW